ncbi:MAG: 1,2-phenylacetyl-CoA epoxidase subunit PaaD [Geminicoccaceae bacterium]
MPGNGEDRLSRARAALQAVTDPEIPVLTIADLGVLRDVCLTAADEVEAVITPTYSGCPAMRMIELEVETALLRAAVGPVRVTTVLTPSWTTDWLSAEGRAKLTAYGIAPPAEGAAQGRAALFAADPDIACPRCGSTDTEKVSEFGSTACKAHWRCRTCLEPFDYFKCI